MNLPVGRNDDRGIVATFGPAPGGASSIRMIIGHALMEFRLNMRNGEQLILTAIIPVILLIGLTKSTVVSVTASTPDVPRIDVVTPGILALAVMSTAFTGQAIATGFERRYGVIKLLGSTPLPRWGLVAAKTLAVLVIEAGQVVVLSLVAFALGWSPSGSLLNAVVLIVAGTAAFCALALVVAGTLRAEATLAVANGLYLVLLLAGGVVIPLAKLPSGLARIAELLPSGALGQGLRDVLTAGESMPWKSLAVLVVWAVGGALVAHRTFRWE
jgi:ABC-2 type transport system permease protein